MPSMQDLTPQQLAAVLNARSYANEGEYTAAMRGVGLTGRPLELRDSQNWEYSDPNGIENSQQRQGTPSRYITQQIDGSSSHVWDPQTGKYLGLSSGMSENAQTLAALTMLAGGAYGAYAAGAGAGAGAGVAGGAAGGAGTAGTAGGLVSLTPAEIAATNTAATAGLGSQVAGTLPAGLSAGTAATGAGLGAGAYTSAAADSQAANSALGLSSTSTAPSGVTLSNAGGTMSTAGGLSGGASGTTGGTGMTSSGWDLLGKAAGGVLAAGAGANGLSAGANTGTLDQLLQGYLNEMQKTTARGDDQWNNYLSTFRPVEQKYASSALNYDTPERRQTAANEAMGNVASQFDTARTQGLRDLQAAGADLSTIRALGASSLIEEAKAKAGAANQARNTIETQGLGLLQNAAQFGRNLPSTSLQASGVATGQGNSAANASVQSNQLGLAASNQRNQLFGDLLGAGLKAYGMYTGGG